MKTVAIDAERWNAEAEAAIQLAAEHLVDHASMGRTDRLIRAGQLLDAAQRFRGRANMIEANVEKCSFIDIEEFEDDGS